MAQRWQTQLPKWHPLHREPEEQKMLPGTERALIVLTETMLPRLNKAIVALTIAVKDLAKPKLPDSNENQVVALVLTKEQWIELLEAISSKATQVRDGRYGDGSEEPKTDIVKWANELDLLERSVHQALVDQGVRI